MTQIAFTGDVAFTKHFSESSYDENLFDNNIISFLSSSDYTVVNVEGAVSSLPKRTDKPLTHANPIDCVNQIKRINGNIWSLANNHTMDCGAEGLTSTLSAAKENGFNVIGAGEFLNEAQKPYIINEEGGIGIIAVTYFTQNRADNDTSGCFIADDEEEVKRKIKEVKRNNRWCIVVSHVGQEFSQIAMPYVRKRYKRYLEYGADIIVGHHSHVVQNYEKIGDKIIFYSLGNFVFDTDYQRIQKYTDYGMLLKIKFNANDYSWEYLPVKNNREKMQLSKCEIPAIFKNINSFEYGLLWPLAARHLSLNLHKKNIFHHPEYAKRSWFEWLFKYDIKRCKTLVGKDIIKGRFFSLFGLWKFADKNIVKYIKEK